MFIPILCLLLIIITLIYIHTTSQTLHLKSPILLLTAHPDDESMFFAPTIAHQKVQILCLSNGNDTCREKELEDAMKVLQVEGEIYQDERIQDGPWKWDTDVIAEIVSKYVEEKGIQSIITFDHLGVSSHPNHISLYEALPSIRKACKRKIHTYALETVPLFRKYVSILDYPQTCLRRWIGSALPGKATRSALYISQPWTARAAMTQHRSQYVWFRRIWCFISRYMVINELKEQLD